MLDVNQTMGNPGASRVNPLPSTLLGLMSYTSSAPDCFINQRFSNKLQAFLIGYVGSTVMTPQSVYEGGLDR